jgi:hypothetical protein
MVRPLFETLISANKRLLAKTFSYVAKHAQSFFCPTLVHISLHSFKTGIFNKYIKSRVTLPFSERRFFFGELFMEEVKWKIVVP